MTKIMEGNDQPEAVPYEVGYGRPPKDHQWAKGQSGNPGGRKRAPKPHSVMIAEAFAEKAPVKINGRTLLMSKIELAFTQLANKAAGGDRHATKALLDFLAQAQTREQAQASDAPMNAAELRTADMALLAAVREMTLNLESEAPDALAA